MPRAHGRVMATHFESFERRDTAGRLRPVASVRRAEALTEAVRRAAATRHSLGREIGAIAIIYLGYEATRAFIVGNADLAVRHAHQIVGLERTFRIFVEHEVQRAALAVPGLIAVLGFSYLTFHLGLTGAYLLWAYLRRPDTFPLLRTTLLLATALSIIGYIAFPTAPPRLAGLGILDTVSGGHVDLNEGMVHSLYNPFAAIPSMHFGYALIIGVHAVANCRWQVTRVAGALYPAFVLFVIVATGNHFVLDAVAGAFVAIIAAIAANAITTRRTPTLETSEPPGDVERVIDLRAEEAALHEGAAP
jgi:hypothetical protein